MRSSMMLLLASGAVGVFGAIAAAQPGGGKQPEPAKATAPETTIDPAKAPAAQAEFPKAVTKKMYAKNDFRGKKAPEFHVEKWLGKNAKGPDRKDKVVLIDFWATWCPPCRGLIPELNEWHKQFKDDLVVIGVSDEQAGKVEAFAGMREPATDEERQVAKMKTTVEYPMAIDTGAKMKGALGVQGIPHVMVIDSKGIVRWQGFPQSGEDTLTAEVLKQIIAADKAQRGSKAEEKPKEGEKAPEPKKAEAPVTPVVDPKKK